MRHESYKEKIKRTIFYFSCQQKSCVLLCRNTIGIWSITTSTSYLCSEIKVAIGQNDYVRVWKKAGEKWKSYCLNKHKATTEVRCIIWEGITKDGVASVIIPVDSNLNSIQLNTLELLESHL